MTGPKFAASSYKSVVPPIWLLIGASLAATPVDAHADEPAVVFGATHRQFSAQKNTAWAWSAVAEDGPGGPVLFLASTGISPRPQAVGAVLQTADGYAEPIIGPAPDWDVSVPTVSMLTGDSDGNGVPDLYMWESGFINPGMLKVVPFDGLAFGEPIELGYSVHQGCGSIRSFSDLDGDGRAEVVFQRSNDQLGIAWTSRIGQPPEIIDIGFDFDIEAMTDLDADGFCDLLIRDPSRAEFLLLPGIGTDGFGEYRVIVIPSASATAGVLDLTGDGHPEIVLGGFDGMTVMVNDAGMFTPLEVAVADGVAAVRPVSDFDSDGQPDVILRTSSFPRPGDELTWIWRNPLQGFSRDLLWLVEGREGSLIARDMNADGRADLVTLDTNLSVDFRSPAGGSDRLGSSATSIRRDPRHVETVDTDGDGTPELIVTGEIAPKLYRRQADGSYVEENIQGASAFMSRAADFNADGLPDLIVSSGRNSVDFNPGLPGGGFGEINRMTLPAGTQTHQIALADLNADGVMDAAVADVGLGVVHIFHARVGQSPEFAFSVPVGGLARGLCAIDADNDGVQDLVVGDITNKYLRVISQSNGVWAVNAGWPVSHRPIWLTSADIDADGYSDVLLGMEITAPSIHFGSPTGLTETSFSWPGLTTVQDKLELIAVDLTGNGLQDIVYVARGPTRSAWIFLQHTPRAFSFGGWTPGTASTGCAVVDLDSDGALDLVTVSDELSRGVMYMTYGITAGCPADLNADGSLNFFDLAAYLSLFQNNDAGADLAAPFGVLNFFDVSAYLASYNAGCP